MTTIAPTSTVLDPASAAALMTDFGFLATSDLPDRPGPASLVVALRAVPTLHHYDPEAIQYWTNQSGRGISPDADARVAPAGRDRVLVGAHPDSSIGCT